MASLRRKRPEKATAAYLREVMQFQDYARRRLDEGTSATLPKPGADRAKWSSRYGVEETPMSPEDRDAWQRVMEAATGEVDWATAELAARKSGRR